MSSELFCLPLFLSLSQTHTQPWAVVFPPKGKHISAPCCSSCTKWVFSTWDKWSCIDSSSHVWTWELDHKEGWAPKNWYFQIVALEKTLESPLDNKEIKPVSSKGNQPWIFIGRTDAEAEAPILWPPDAKNWLWKRLWCWEKLKAGEEEGDRGWDGWMASLTQWTWV